MRIPPHDAPLALGPLARLAGSTPAEAACTVALSTAGAANIAVGQTVWRF